MRVSAAVLAEYRRLLDALGAQAADRVSAAIAYTAGVARVAPVRDAAIEALSDAAAVEGDMAQALAAQLFDEICAAEGIDAEPGRLFEDVIDEGWIAEKVHWHARALIEGNRAKFDGECRRLADYYVKRCAFENTVRNCDSNDVRYARIPTGSETCPWCMMLASRGFAYHSEESASHGKHVGCDCIVLPGEPGKTKIAGYDENGMRDRWARCQQAAGVKDGDTWWERKRILREAATRDPHWLLTGEPTTIDYSRASRSEYGTLKHRSEEFNPADYEEGNVTDRGIEWRDLFVHDALSSNGFRIATRQSKAVGKDGKVMDGVTTPDIEIDGVMWEIKSVRDGSHSKKNELSFVEQTIRDARRNFRNPYDEAGLKGLGDMTSRTKLVLSTRYRRIIASHEQVIRELSRHSKKYSTEIIWIDCDGSILRFVP